MTAAEEELFRLAAEIAAARGQGACAPSAPSVEAAAEPIRAARVGACAPSAPSAEATAVAAAVRGDTAGRDCGDTEGGAAVMELATIATSSKGNATLVRAGDTAVLVDAGVSARRLTQGLWGLGVDPASLAGIFLTHEHRDHVAGLAAFLKQYDVPVYANRATWQALGEVGVTYARRHIPLTEETVLGRLVVARFAISHDAADPSGFAFMAGDVKGAVCTDLGIVTPTVEAALQGADLLVLEANHDPDMVRYGPYASYLKRRILSDRGHLSNAQSGRLLARLYRGRPMRIVWAHRSETNNRVDQIDATVAAELAREDIAVRRERIRWRHGRSDGSVRIRIMAEERELCYRKANTENTSSSLPSCW